jgi:PhnB protein
MTPRKSGGARKQTPPKSQSATKTITRIVHVHRATQGAGSAKVTPQAPKSETPKRAPKAPTKTKNGPASKAAKKTSQTTKAAKTTKTTRKPTAKKTTRKATKSTRKAPAKKAAKKTPRKTTKSTKAPNKTARRPAAKKTPRKAPRKPSPKGHTTDGGPTMSTMQPILIVPFIETEVAWLEQLGFQRTLTMPAPDGSIAHAILQYGNTTLHVQPTEIPGRPSDPGMEAAKRGPRGIGITLYLMVDDVTRIHRTLLHLRTKVINPPEDQFWGDRTVLCLDPAGYTWTFAQHIRDVTPEEMAQAAAAMGVP